ncbi:MAG: hypothetical protein VKI83_01470 [Synechococcaceae cyanobacterium]|nr:hypothetical protein [Synechococcaceae cyanobacterium]
MTAQQTLTIRDMPRWLRHLPLLLLLAATATGTLKAEERPPGRTLATEQQQQRHRYTGVWALVDNANTLFNVRLNPDGQAISTTGTNGVPLGGSSQLRPNQLYEKGRWIPWGNGVRIDFGDGWSDAILTGPAGPEQWSWAPGANRLDPPSNVGKAVQLHGAVAAAVGVYRIQPAQADRPVTTVSLMSNGLAFNAIDALAGGTWRLQNGEVEITWSSGWLTRFEPKEQGPLQVRIWEPARRHPSPPTAIRPGQRLEALTP